jgi:hypothetical protein
MLMDGAPPWEWQGPVLVGQCRMRVTCEGRVQGAASAIERRGNAGDALDSFREKNASFVTVKV